MPTINTEPQSKHADSLRGRLDGHSRARGGFREFVIIVLGVVTALAADGIRSHARNE